jgi:hypothetical protein
MKRCNRWSVICYFTVIIFFASQLSTSAQSDFPPIENLKERNVSLKMAGFAFTAGLRHDEKGNPNGIGDEIYPIEWCGSGFLIKNDGSIFTNYHVARRALIGKAIFEDGSTYEIKHIKAYQPLIDVAVLKIKSDKVFPTVKLGDSDKVKEIDKVLAVGNTLCEKLAVTDGIINQIKKDDNDVRYELRHSATIAPGNSGGALYKGDEVIGINVAIRPPYPIQYAIPINLAKPLLDEKYNKSILLSDVFVTDFKTMAKKAEQVYAKNDQVAAAALLDNKVGMKAYAVQLLPLEDYIIYLQAQQGRDLVLTVYNANKDLIGKGDYRGVDYDLILLSSENFQEVVIKVSNFDNSPSNFALEVYKIIW